MRACVRACVRVSCCCVYLFRPIAPSSLPGFASGVTTTASSPYGGTLLHTAHAHARRAGFWFLGSFAEVVTGLHPPPPLQQQQAALHAAQGLPVTGGGQAGPQQDLVGMDMGMGMGTVNAPAAPDLFGSGGSGSGMQVRPG